MVSAKNYSQSQNSMKLANRACWRSETQQASSQNTPEPTSAAAPSLMGVASAGFTLIEIMVATAVLLTAIGGIFMTSSRCLRINKSSHDIAEASSALHERMQQLQATDWETLTDSDSYQDQVWTDPETGSIENVDGLLKYATEAGTEVRKQGAVESVTISAFRPVANASPIPGPIKVTRTTTAPSLTSTPSNLVDEKLVRIDMRLTWTDNRLRTARSLAVSGLVAKR